ncbi:ABC transporter permease [Streptomyces albiflavescens]|uniref:ABC transporter permease n=1 Tax=Streptomyces albiflavescens TaxID=1623582 RepID=UPI00166A76C7|nr:ABC transporter permease [Streptomyces albiflavescens]
MKTPLVGHQSWRHVAIMAVALPLVISLAVMAYAWPAARIAPRDLPVGIVGTSTASQGAVEGLAHSKPGGFDFHLYPDEASARSAIRERDVYGAFVVAPSSLTVLESTAASPTVAQLLGKTGQQLAAHASKAAADRAASSVHGTSARSKKGEAGPKRPAQIRVRTVDVVQTSVDDPRGVVFSSALLPLTICSIMIALVIAMSRRLRPGSRLMALIVVSGAAALGVYVVAQGFLGALPHEPLATWASLSLTILAISATTAGVLTLVGSAGLGLSAALMVFVGNPFSGSTSAPELLPKAVEDIGQWLPPGAGASLVRGTAYFNGNDSAGHIAVLTLWSVLGLAAVLFGHRASRVGNGPVAHESATPGTERPANDVATPQLPLAPEESADSSSPARIGMHAHSHARHAAGT